MEEEKKESTKEEKKAGKVKSGNFVRDLLSGIVISDKIVLKNFWYIVLITFLGALYIANRFNAEKVTREAAKLTREVRDLKAESLSTSASLMYVSKQSEVFTMVREKGLGLEELKTPPYKLIVDK